MEIFTGSRGEYIRRSSLWRKDISTVLECRFWYQWMSMHERLSLNEKELGGNGDNGKWVLTVYVSTLTRVILVAVLFGCPWPWWIKTLQLYHMYFSRHVAYIYFNESILCQRCAIWALDEDGLVITWWWMMVDHSSMRRSRSSWENMLDQ